MDAQRWQWIQTLFHEAAAMPAEGRQEFLNEACAGDTEGMLEVLSLLEEDERGISMLDGVMGRVATSVIDGAASLIHRTVGPYRLEKLLGEGGMGVVYLAAREDLENQVAIKLLPNAWMSPARRGRFSAEQRTLSRLNHPSIARLYDAGTLEDGTPWFAMEYVDGQPINEYCDSRGETTDARLRLFRAVCEAVQYAHQRAVLHRDLKPANILVKADGGVRLLDFGIAKQMDRDENLTQAGLRLATPAYAAPEQLRGEPAAIQADVYSLGVILYQLLHGTLPAATAHSGADLDMLCATAIHSDSRRRYQSVEALIRDIDHFLKSEPLDARPDTFGYRLRKFASRRRRPLIAAALVLLMMGGMALFFTLRLAAARDAALAEAARTQRAQQFMMHLFDGGDSSAGPAENLKVLTLVDRSAREVQALSADPAAQSDLYHTLGTVYQSLGKFDRADEMLQSALGIRRSLQGGKGSNVSESLVTLGLLRQDQGKQQEAEKLVREGLDLARTTLPPTHPAIASATAALGRVLTGSGQYDEAIRTLEQALQVMPSSATPTQEMATVLLRMSDAHFEAGRYKESEVLTRRVLDLYRRMYGDRHPRVAEPLINLGAIEQQRAHYQEAEKYYRQALGINRDYYGAEHPETTTSLMGIARALQFQKKYAEAEPILQEVLALRERTYGKVHPNVASVLGSLGGVALSREKFDDAEKYLQRMLDIYHQVYGAQHHYVALAMSNLASVYLAKSDYHRAEELFRKAIDCYGKVLPPDHFDVGIGQVKLGRVLLKERRFQEAEGHSLAGLKILEKKTGSSSPWIISAHKDLAEIHQALAH